MLNKTKKNICKCIYDFRLRKDEKTSITYFFLTFLVWLFFIIIILKRKHKQITPWFFVYLADLALYKNHTGQDCWLLQLCFLILNILIASLWMTIYDSYIHAVFRTHKIVSRRCLLLLQSTVTLLVLWWHPAACETIVPKTISM